jgi:hypothetical protein
MAALVAVVSEIDSDAGTSCGDEVEHFCAGDICVRMKDTMGHDGTTNGQGGG